MRSPTKPPGSLGTAREEIAVTRRVASGRLAELWLAAQRGPDGSVRPVLAQRWFAAAQDPELRGKLAAMARQGQHVQHPNLVGRYGVVSVGEELVALYEVVDGVDLLRALEELRARGQRLDPKTAVWIAREVVRTLVELAVHVQEPALEGPSRPLGGLLLCRDGTVKVGGRSAPEVDDLPDVPIGRPEEAGILLDALLPAGVACARAPGEGGWKDLAALENALGRVFYVDLAGNDQSDGVTAVSALVDRLVPPPERAPSGPHGPKETSGGSLRPALEARAGPVVPMPLTMADSATGSVAVEPPSVPYAARRGAPALAVATEENLATAEPFEGSRERATPGRGQRLARPVLWFTLGFISALLLVELDRQIGRRGKAPETSRPVSSSVSADEATRAPPEGLAK